MTKFVCCGRSGVVGSDDYGCVGLYRAIDPTIPEDLPRVVLQILGVWESFYDASVCSAETMGVAVCPDCPARIIKEVLKKR